MEYVAVAGETRYLTRESRARNVRKMARRRVLELWRLSVQVATDEPQLAREWVGGARRIAQKARMKLPDEMKRNICRRCDTVLIPGRTSRVRLHARGRHMTVTCLNCGRMKRYRFK